ncbi:MAG: winged helix-turn-helix transcriptional regulator [Desulfurococcaceae archaeon TW002]
MSENIYKKVIEYLKTNPGAMPREIADALGVSIGMVRIALLRLRELGYVVRSGKGGYVVKSSSGDLETRKYADIDAYEKPRKQVREEVSTQVERDLSTLKEYLNTEISRLRSEVGELRKIVESLSDRVSKVEAEFTLLMKSLKPEKKAKEEVSEVGGDVIMRVDVARNRGISVDSLVRSGNYVIVSNYVVLQSFMDEFKKRFPISLRDVRNLTSEERELLNAMVSEGLAYLHAGKEYRLA